MINKMIDGSRAGIGDTADGWLEQLQQLMPESAAFTLPFMFPRQIKQHTKYLTANRVKCLNFEKFGLKVLGSQKMVTCRDNNENLFVFLLMLKAYKCV
ncbi:hypothetical protein O9993_11895 [Vibrio lentus]|nr:hypothetical protein [Vibrio lentus]